jgi:hypothetical protein
MIHFWRQMGGLALYETKKKNSRIPWMQVRTKDKYRPLNRVAASEVIINSSSLI